jgi:hypothetical protein
MVASAAAGIAKMVEGYEEFCAAPVDTVSHAEVLSVLTQMEALTRRLPSLSHRLLARFQREACPRELGAKSLQAVLTERLRIGGTEAHRRLHEAAELGPRVALTGEPLGPVLAKVAAAQADGRIGGEHVRLLRRFFDQLPLAVDAVTRELCEDTLVGVAVGQGPEELRAAAERLKALLDQDGPVPDDAERARKRCIRLGKQQPDGMTPVTGWLDPEGRATDAGPDPDGRPRPPLSGGLRPPHRGAAVPRAQPAVGVSRAADRAAQPGSGVHQTRLHGVWVRQPGPPHPRLGQKRWADQRRRGSPGLRG